MPAAAFRDIELIDDIIAGREMAFGERRGLRELPGCAAPNDFVRAYRQLGLKALPHWKNAVLKQMPCRNHNGLVCILVGIKDWKRLVDEIKTDRILADLNHLAAETLRPRNGGVPYALVVYAGEVPSKVRRYFVDRESSPRRLETNSANSGQHLRVPSATRAGIFGAVASVLGGIATLFYLIGRYALGRLFWVLLLICLT